MPGRPFHFDDLATTPARRGAMLVARPFLSWLSGLPTYRALYRLTQSKGDGPFECRALEALEIEARVEEEDRARIPSKGPLVVASNHPHGILDGLALASILGRHRTDVRILTNYLLARIPELAQLCFFVDPFGGPGATARSQAGLRAAHLWLKAGGALVVFPSGEVAYRTAPSGARIDSSWQPVVGRLALSTGAQVLPTFILGKNSRLFYAAGRVHPALRTALLARELLRKRGRVVTVRFGAPMFPRELSVVDTGAAAVTESIRQRVDRLAKCHQEHRHEAESQIDPVPSEVAHLPADSCLIEGGGFQVFLAEAAQIPHTLQEIGRLREITFRAVGEGTGRQLDLDRFDHRYLHLFSWDRQQKCIVGAYRIGPTDRIVATHGIDGLYTRTLFRYDERLMTRLSPALELGRAFIRAEYQKNYNALLLLWRGIGQFVVRHPQYRVLFGPVSISSRYSDGSHRLLMAFLRQNHLHRDFSDLVEALNPLTMAPAPAQTLPRSIDEAHRLIVAAERDGKGVPILLRQYLRLNAKLLGFNVDPKFGDAVDALMMVDLTTVDVAILNRYLGRQETANYLAQHRTRLSADAA